jgi:hypothetical protein
MTNRQSLEILSSIPYFFLSLQICIRESLIFPFEISYFSEPTDGNKRVHAEDDRFHLKMRSRGFCNPPSRNSSTWQCLQRHDASVPERLPLARVIGWRSPRPLVRMSRLSKRGNQHLRRLIWLMTFCAIRMEGPFKTYFVSRKTEGLPFKKALFATAHKRVRVIFFMLNNRTCFVAQSNA